MKIIIGDTLKVLQGDTISVYKDSINGQFYFMVLNNGIKVETFNITESKILVVE